MPIESTALMLLESVLRTENGQALMELMRDLVLERTSKGNSDPLVEIAERISLIKSVSGEIRLTEFGRKVGHSLREYLHWEERGRRMPRIDQALGLREEFFRDCDVLEIGSGFGCNLLTLQSVARSVVGVDIEPLYSSLSTILAGIAGQRPPLVIVGGAEAIPRQDASADIVLLISSIQYTQIDTVLAEIRRVLRPQGRVVIHDLTFRGFLRRWVRRVANHRTPKRAVREGVVALSAATYPLCGRRFLREWEPLHLPFAVMRKRLKRAGFTMSEEETHILGDEVVYVACKR